MTEPVLVEIAPGAWYDPDLVNSIQVYADVKKVLRSLFFRSVVVIPANRSMVRIVLTGLPDIDYYFSTLEEALVEAAMIATKVNALRKGEGDTP